MKNELGKKIKEYRLKNNMSQQALADASQVSKSYINKIEHNQSKCPSIEVLYRISVVLKIEPSLLINLGGYDIDDLYIEQKYVNDYIMNYKINKYDKEICNKYINNNKVDIDKVIKDIRNEKLDNATGIYLFMHWIQNRNINN